MERGGHSIEPKIQSMTRGWLDVSFWLRLNDRVGPTAQERAMASVRARLVIQ